MEKSNNGKEALLFFFKISGFAFLYTIIFILLAVWGYRVANDTFYDASLYINDGDYTQMVSNSNDKITVIIDAGHGGEDSGAVSDGGVLEKDLNLQISNKIVDFLKFYNINTVMTRENDRLLYSEGDSSKKRGDLSGRVNFAKQYDDPIFVSIHMNKFSIPKYSGLQTFYSKNDLRSEALALQLQANVKELLQPDNNRLVKAAGSNIFILDRLQCPAILVECGFLSNYDETMLLQNEEYQNKLAFVIAMSIVEYINV